MRGDICPAAFRLLCALPSRVHERDPDEQKKLAKQMRYYYANRGAKKQAEKKPGVGRGGNQGKRVTIDGRRFESIKEACERMHVGHHKLYAWLASGRARCE